MKKRAVPLGKPLDTSDAELDLESLVTPGDIEAARADAARHMPPLGRALLEAEPAGDAPPPPDETAAP